MSGHFDGRSLPEALKADLDRAIAWQISLIEKQDMLIKMIAKSMTQLDAMRPIFDEHKKEISQEIVGMSYTHINGHFYISILKDPIMPSEEKNNKLSDWRSKLRNLQNELFIKKSELIPQVDELIQQASELSELLVSEHNSNACESSSVIDELKEISEELVRISEILNKLE